MIPNISGLQQDIIDWKTALQTAITPVCNIPFRNGFGALRYK